MANFLVWVVWFGAAFACLASALAVVSFRNPFYSALALIGNLASLAVLFLLLSGEHLGSHGGLRPIEIPKRGSRLRIIANPFRNDVAGTGERCLHIANLFLRVEESLGFSQRIQAGLFREEFIGKRLKSARR